MNMPDLRHLRPEERQVGPLPLPAYIQDRQRLEEYFQRDLEEHPEQAEQILPHLTMQRASPTDEVWARWDRWKERLKIVPAPEPRAMDVPDYILHRPELSIYLKQCIDEDLVDEMAGRIPLLDESNPVQVHERFVRLLERTEDKIIADYIGEYRGGQ